jgi:hypothetical protein
VAQHGTHVARAGSAGLGSYFTRVSRRCQSGRTTSSQPPFLAVTRDMSENRVWPASTTAWDSFEFNDEHTRDAYTHSADLQRADAQLQQKHGRGCKGRGPRHLGGKHDAPAYRGLAPPPPIKQPMLQPMYTHCSAQGHGITQQAAQCPCPTPFHAPCKGTQVGVLARGVNDTQLARAPVEDGSFYVTVQADEVHGPRARPTVQLPTRQQAPAGNRAIGRHRHKGHEGCQECPQGQGEGAGVAGRWVGRWVGWGGCRDPPILNQRQQTGADEL